MTKYGLLTYSNARANHYNHQMGLKMVDSTMKKVNISVMSMITLASDLKSKSASAKVLSGRSSSVTITKRKRLLL